MTPNNNPIKIRFGLVEPIKFSNFATSHWLNCLEKMSLSVDKSVAFVETTGFAKFIDCTEVDLAWKLTVSSSPIDSQLDRCRIVGELFN